MRLYFLQFFSLSTFQFCYFHFIKILATYHSTSIISRDKTSFFSEIRPFTALREWIKAYHHKKLSPRAVMV